VNPMLLRAGERILRWRRAPWKMVEEEFGVTPDRWQRRVLEAFADPSDPKKQRIAMRAAKGPGKTAVEAWCVWNFLACYGDRLEHPKAAVTSITGKNLDDNLWTELAKWQRQSRFLSAAFTWTKERIYANDHPETWWCSKRTWAKDADQQKQSETLAGLHSAFMFFVLDESGGIPRAIMATAEAALATKAVGGWRFQKILQGGNPTHLTGPLYDAATKDRKLWFNVVITGDPDDPDRSPRISKRWARQQIRMHGRDNPWVKVNVFGEFPPASLNALLGPDEVERAMKLRLRPESYDWAQRRLGVDVARFGDDRTVLFPRQGLQAFKPIILRGLRTTEIAARVMLFRSRWQPELIVVDDTGHWGHGVIDNLLAARVPAIPVQYSAPAIDFRYKNRRTEGWLQMAEWVRRGGSLPRMDELIPELTEPTYTFVNGVFQLEDKDQIKERLGYSPDLADALAETFMLPERPASSRRSGLPRGGEVLVERQGAARARLDAELAEEQGHHFDYEPLEEYAP